MANQATRDTGIDLIGRAPWGTHFCQFYETKQDLIDILVPYFKAGLRDNEYCMWVTSPPLVREEAEQALRDALPDLDRYMEKGQIEILSYDQWYVIDGVFDSDRVLDGWVARTEQAQARGFDGLRLSGNTFWLERNGWKRFAQYEEEVNNVIGNYAMMAACTYSLERCSASEIVDVISNHQFAIIKRAGRWEVFESAEHKRLEEERRRTELSLRELEQRYTMLFEHLTEGFALHEMIYDTSGNAVDYRFLAANPAFERLTGLKREKVIGRTVREIVPNIEQFWIDTYADVVRTGHPVSFEQFAAPLGRYYEVHAFRPEGGRFAALFLDVTARRRAEEQVESVARFPADNPNPVLRISNEGRVLYANRAGSKLLSPSKARVGKPAPRFLRDPVQEALAKASPITVDVSHADRVWYFTVAPIVGAGYANLYGSDVTERRRAEEALVQTGIDLNRAQAVGHIGSWRLDVRNDVLEWSDETYRIFGIPQGTSMTYEAFLACVHPEDRESVNEAWQASLSGEPYNIDHRIAVGEAVKWVHEQAELEFDEHGQLLGGFGTCQDITERKTAEAERDRLLLELDTVIESVPIGIGIYDTQGRVLRVNPAQLRISGYRQDQFPLPIEERLPQFAPQTMDGKALDADLVPVNRAIKGEVVESFVIRFTRPNGETVWASTGAAPLRNKDGEVVGAVGAVLDITDLRRLQEDLERALAAKDDFLSMVSHEMRTPLTAVLGGASLLLSESPLDEEGRLEVVREIRESAGRLAATINNMLALARVEAGRTIQFERFGTEGAIKDLVARHCDRNKHRQVRVNVSGKIPDALASKEYFAHILSNLLENAEKYAPRHEPIEVVLARDGTELSVRVRDRGIGLEPEEAKNIFEPFYRSPRIASVSPGVGIGLAVSKRLVEAQGGRIWARRRKGGGSEFGFTLPIADGDSPPIKRRGTGAADP